MNIIIGILIGICILITLASAAFYGFAGILFNDTANALWAHILEVAFLGALAITIVTIILVFIPWVQQREWLRVSILILGIILTLCSALYPFSPYAKSRLATADQVGNQAAKTQWAASLAGISKDYICDSNVFLHLAPNFNNSAISDVIYYSSDMSDPLNYVPIATIDPATKTFILSQSSERSLLSSCKNAQGKSILDLYTEASQ
jgi:hypothetical protein